MNLRDHIVEQAMSLPPEDRAFVADKLEQSLSADSFATPELAKAWAEEIERRLAAYDRGEVQAIGGGMAIDSIRQKLAQHRGRKVSS